MTKSKDIVCPTCGRADTWKAENKFKPFCSKRCKLIDLGDWADEKFRVAGDPVDPENQNDDDEK